MTGPTLQTALRAMRRERRLVEDIDRCDAISQLAHRVPEQRAAARRARELRFELLRVRLGQLSHLGPREPVAVDAVTDWARRQNLDSAALDDLLSALDPGGERREER